MCLGDKWNERSRLKVGVKGRGAVESVCVGRENMKVEDGGWSVGVESGVSQWKVIKCHGGGGISGSGLEVKVGD